MIHYGDLAMYKIMQII